jgi:hypothetical protein
MDQRRYDLFNSPCGSPPPLFTGSPPPFIPPGSSYLAIVDLAGRVHHTSRMSATMSMSMGSPYALMGPLMADSERDHPRESWFQFFECCFPKSLSEPWMGDIRERRETMRLEGYPTWKITCATAIQIVVLLLHWSISRGLDVLSSTR